MIILFFGLFVANSYYIHINHRIRRGIDRQMLRYVLQVSFVIELILVIAIVVIPLSCWGLIQQLQLSPHLPWLVSAYWLCGVVSLAWLLLLMIKIVNYRRLSFSSGKDDWRFKNYGLFLCLVVIVLVSLLVTLHDAVFQQPLFSRGTFLLSSQGLYNWVKIVHVVSACVLFGTGVGTAFFMLIANLLRRVALIARATRQVVVADWIFTGSSAVIQVATGLAMIYLKRYTFHELWVIGSIAGYVIAGLCWLPVVAIQIRCRDLAEQAFAEGKSLSRQYYRLLLSWCALGVPAFLALLGVIYLMTEKPIW